MAEVRESLPALRLPALRRLGATTPGAQRVTGWRGADITGAVSDITGVQLTASAEGLVVEGLLPPLVGWTEFVPWAWSENPYGKRKWLSCPTCDRRCGSLYVLDGPSLVCGDCTGLPYLMAVVGRRERLQHKRLLARRACGLDDFGRGELRRPRGMRVNCWLKLLDRLDRAELAVLVDLGVDVSAARSASS